MLVSKGEQIICPNGHVVGSVSDDIADGNLIPTNVVRIKFEKLSLSGVGHDGHICACGQRVTEQRDGLYRIHTNRGWIGRLP